MNATPEYSETHDTRREVDRWLGNYSEDHRNPTNVLIHWICVPLIVWAAVALLWVVPVPAILGPRRRARCRCARHSVEHYRICSCT